MSYVDSLNAVIDDHLQYSTVETLESIPQNLYKFLCEEKFDSLSFTGKTKALAEMYQKYIQDNLFDQEEDVYQATKNFCDYLHGNLLLDHYRLDVQ